MKIIAALLFGVGYVCRPGNSSGRYRLIYRYEWVPQGQSQPTPLGTGRSGYIDLLAPRPMISPNFRI